VGTLGRFKVLCLPGGWVVLLGPGTVGNSCQVCPKTHLSITVLKTGTSLLCSFVFLYLADKHLWIFLLFF